MSKYHRERFFHIALATERTNISRFARLHGVSHTAIINVLHGRRKSQRLERVIDTFIKEQFSKLGITLKSFQEHSNAA